jgi:alkylated DNA repair dioxygenase AlkB
LSRRLPPTVYPAADLTSVTLEAPDADLRYIEAALSARESEVAFRTLRDEIEWEQHRIRIFGREVPCPRRSAWLGDPGAAYSYSGIRLEPKPWTATLTQLRERVEHLSGAHFNSVLLNLYRDGRDSMGWHADDEPELGERATIASLSLGAARQLSLRHTGKTGVKPLKPILASGSLLIMAGETQRHWQHQLAKTRKPVGERINLTFRSIRARSDASPTSAPSGPAATRVRARQ